MKLRIKGNSIRLRLLRSEVERFAIDGKISDELGFGASALRYSLKMSEKAESINATFANNEIEVLLPDAVARNWIANDEVGFATDQAIRDDQVLTILIEKDFACIDRPDDPDREQAYPNPNAVC